MTTFAGFSGQIRKPRQTAFRRQPVDAGEETLQPGEVRLSPHAPTAPADAVRGPHASVARSPASADVTSSLASSVKPARAIESFVLSWGRNR